MTERKRINLTLPIRLALLLQAEADRRELEVGTYLRMVLLELYSEQLTMVGEGAYEQIELLGTPTVASGRKGGSSRKRTRRKIDKRVLHNTPGETGENTG